MSVPILKAEKIYKSFENGVNVLRGIDLELQKGQSIAIMGASGEGKTTILHILGGLETPTSGSIFVTQEKISEKNSSKIRKLIIGYVFQTYNLLEDLSLLENILMPAKIARQYSPSMRQQALKILKEVNLEHKSLTLTKYLSGGEKQRAAIARSFCCSREIILADEPSGNLDRTNSAIVHQLLLSFVKEKNKSLIIATHDEELANLCDKKLLLKEGLLYEI